MTATGHIWHQTFFDGSTGLEIADQHSSCREVLTAVRELVCLALIVIRYCEGMRPQWWTQEPPGSKVEALTNPSLWALGLCRGHPSTPMLRGALATPSATYQSGVVFTMKGIA